MSEGRVSARKDPSNLIVTCGPDVCLTPVGAAMAPVAYTTVGNLGDAVRISTSVRNNGNYDFQLNSRVPHTTGHEAGVGTNVMSGGYKGHAHAKTAEDFVYSEGFATVAHRDPAWINRPGLGPIEPRKDMGEESV